MIWTVFIIVLAVVIAGSRLVRYSLKVLAVMGSIALLLWLLMGRAPDRAQDEPSRHFVRPATP